MRYKKNKNVKNYLDKSTGWLDYLNMMNVGYLKCGRTDESDEVLTPRYAVEPIVKYLRQSRYVNILCPFDKNDSQYVRVLRGHGFHVTNTHIENKDFFTYTRMDMKGVDCIVSNPPFSKKDEVLERLFALHVPFAILLPQNALQGKRRTALFQQYGLEYLGFDTRISFYTRGQLDKIQKNNHFASGYFCHYVLPERLVFEHLECIQEPYAD